MSSLSLTGNSLHQDLVERRARLRTAIEISPRRQDFRSLLDRVDRALSRLDGGTYGLCRVCHDPIEADRLTADPLLHTCLDCLTPTQQRDLEHDLDRAAQIQSALLPPRDLLTPGWEIDYHYEPAGPVSGDFCDVIPAAPGGDETYFFLGDVSGKGVSASILMSHLQAVFRGLVRSREALPGMVATANRMFCESTLPSHYATVVVGRANRSGDVEIVNAGHCAPLIVSTDGMRVLPSTGLPIGMFSSGGYTSTKIKLRRGESIVLYTDGLPEAENGGTETYGSERIASLLASRRGESAAEMARACVEGVKAFRNGSPRGDDLTVMVVRRQSPCER